MLIQDIQADEISRGIVNVASNVSSPFLLDLLCMFRNWGTMRFRITRMQCSKLVGFQANKQNHSMRESGRSRESQPVVTTSVSVFRNFRNQETAPKRT